MTQVLPLALLLNLFVCLYRCDYCALRFELAHAPSITSAGYSSSKIGDSSTITKITVSSSRLKEKEAISSICLEADGNGSLTCQRSTEKINMWFEAHDIFPSRNPFNCIKGNYKKTIRSLSLRPAWPMPTTPSEPPRLKTLRSSSWTLKEKKSFPSSLTLLHHLYSFNHHRLLGLTSMLSATEGAPLAFAAATICCPIDKSIVKPQGFSHLHEWVPLPEKV